MVKRMIILGLLWLMVCVAMYNIGKIDGENVGYYDGYVAGNQSGTTRGYFEGTRHGFAQAIAYKNYYIKDSSKYIVNPDASDEYPYSSINCFADYSVTKVKSTTASMFPTLTYFDTIKFVDVNATERLQIGQIYMRSLKTQDNKTDDELVAHRLVDCADYPKCNVPIFKGDNNLYRDDAVNRSDYNFFRVFSVDFGNSSRYYESIRLESG